jgi:pimeloyl-ACP methyl ester carboxylesterase
MRTTISGDGTKIAYDVRGEGPAVLLVWGALSTRLSGFAPELTEVLAQDFTVYNYDRRGRGDSGDTKPYAIEREIEDLEALVDAAGGSAYLFGHSSGAVLALESAIRLNGKVGKLAMYEAPYNNDSVAQLVRRKYIKQLTDALTANRRSDAVELFMKQVGMPPEQIVNMRHTPAWPALEAIAPTLAYDHAVFMGMDISVPTEHAAMLGIPALIMNGSASPRFMRDTAQTLAQAMPQAKYLEFEGQTHNVDVKVLAPALVSFFSE